MGEASAQKIPAIIVIITIIISINTLSLVRTAKDKLNLSASVTGYLESPFLQEAFPDYSQQSKD